MISDNRRKAALEALTAYADELRAEIERQTSRLSRELEAIEQFIHALSGDIALDGVQNDTSSTQGIDREYAALGPQPAVEKFLRDHPNQAFRSAEVANRLQANGFTVGNPKLLRQQVLIALGRAVKKGLASEITALDGKREFRLAMPLS